MVASGVVVERIDREREWVCAGEPMALSARLGGASEPGTVSRWVWLTAGGAELQPGPKLSWRAPARAGRYVVRFQACRDLGGRRVGVLAERDVAIEVRDCGAGERQASEPLRIDVTQTRHGAFAFRAVYRGPTPLASYAWDFGDGATASTGPEVEHAYAVEEMAPDALESFIVKLRATPTGGTLLETTAFALVRGQPPPEEPPRVELSVSRWRPAPLGGGWLSDLSVANPTPSAITWDTLQRVTIYWNGTVDVDTQPWSRWVRVEEDLGLGGFRGLVTVDAFDSHSDVKAILDALHGRDDTGQEVVVRWSPYKSEAPLRPREDEIAPPPNVK